MPINNKLHSSNTPSAGSGGGTSDATAANQVTGNNSLASIDSKLPTTGQKTMSNSQPIVIASDQSPIPITRTLSAPTIGTITNASSTVTVTNLNDTGAVTVSVYGTYAGVNFTFEAFDGVNWFIIPAQRVDTGDLESATGVIGSVTRAWNVSPLLGFTQFRVRATAYTSGTANIILQPSSQFVPVQIRAGLVTGTSTIGSVASITTSIVPGNANNNLGKAEDAAATSGDTGIFPLGVRRDTQTVSASATGDYNEFAVDEYGNTMIRKYGTQKRTYSTAFSITTGTTPTDVVEIIGSATTRVELTRLSVNGSSTAATSQIITWIKRSTASTGGTSTNQTLVPHLAADAAATAIIKAFTVAPTVGSAIGIIRRINTTLQASTSPDATKAVVYTFGENSKTLMLSGIAQTLCLNLGGSAPAGTVLDIEIELTEI